MLNLRTVSTKHLTPSLLAVLAGVLLAVAGEGPDFGHYTDWAAAALTGDIFALRGNVLSPGGVPFSLAAAGPGLLFAVGKVLLLPFTLESAAMATGWVAAIVFWTSALIVLVRVAEGNEWLALFGGGALFIGTHAGLYSHSYATEVFANALIAVLWALALTRDEWRPILDGVLVGALTGLLLLVRAHVVLYALPTLWLAVFGRSTIAEDLRRLQVVSGRPSRDSTPRLGAIPFEFVSGRLLAMRMIAVAVPIAIAVAQYTTVNRWMTGSLTHPPYVYGGDGFTSVDLWHPQLAAVLTHPWHGLLSYHPLYGIAFVALVAEAWRTGRLRALWVVTVVAVVAHVWVQAGWYIWWLGGSTFGMRGMAPAALPLVAGLVAAIRREVDARPTRAAIWMIATVAACVWSYPLLLRGNTTYYTWAGLWSSQHAAATGAVVVSLGSLVWLSRREWGSTPLAQLTRAMTVLLGGSVVLYLAMQLVMLPAFGAHVAKALAGSAVVGGGLALIRRSRVAAAWSGEILLLGALAVFAAQALLFERLALDTSRYQAKGAPPARGFEYAGTSPVDELRVTYREYQEVPGFQDRKAAFRRFLTWQRIAVTPMAAADRRIAEAVRTAILTDAAFDDLLVEATAHGGIVHISATGMSHAQQSRARQLALAVPGAVNVSFSKQ